MKNGGGWSEKRSIDKKRRLRYIGSEMIEKDQEHGKEKGKKSKIES